MPKQAHIAGQIANRGEMAGILGISPTTLDRYVQAGCPFLEKGSGRREYRFNTADVIRWVPAREANPNRTQPDDTRRRYNAAAAELKEYQLAEKRRSMIRVEDIAALKTSSRMFGRGYWRSPITSRPRSSGMTDSSAIEAALDDEVAAALTELTVDDRERSPLRVGAD